MKGVGRVDALVSQCLSVPLKKMVSKSHNPEPRRPTSALACTCSRVAVVAAP